MTKDYTEDQTKGIFNLHIMAEEIAGEDCCAVELLCDAIASVLSSQGKMSFSGLDDRISESLGVFNSVEAEMPPDHILEAFGLDVPKRH